MKPGGCWRGAEGNVAAFTPEDFSAFSRAACFPVVYPGIDQTLYRYNKKRLARVLTFLGSQMSTIQQQITEKFLIRLALSTDVDAEKIEQLRNLLADSKKPKVADFVNIFTFPAGGYLK
jgi:hypothetical protein